MSSLLTNISAMAALQTLKQITASMNDTSASVATGLAIREASDSPAYWSVATTIKSDRGALETVRDALSIGKATFDVVYNGLESVRENLQTMKELLVSAKQPGVNRTDIQTQIDGLIADMQTQASASVINEQNFLSVDSSAADYNANKTIVASFERNGAAVSVSTITLNIDDVKLIDTNGNIGLLDQTRTTTNSNDTSVIALAGNEISNIDDTAASQLVLDDYIELVDAAIVDVISASNSVGIGLARAESQETFINTLIDAKTAAAGALVDADIEAQSTKLQALQTQQQLAVQSLAISNTSSASILTLFR